MPGSGLAEVDEAGEGAGEGGAFDGEAADLGVFGAVGFFFGAVQGPIRASASVQAVLPSAALGLIEKPSGRVTVAARSSEGEGTVGLSCWGTLEIDVDARGRCRSRWWSAGRRGWG